MRKDGERLYVYVTCMAMDLSEYVGVGCRIIAVPVMSWKYHSIKEVLYFLLRSLWDWDLSYHLLTQSVADFIQSHGNSLLGIMPLLTTL